MSQTSSHIDRLDILVKLSSRIRNGIRKGKPVSPISRRQTGLFRKEGLAGMEIIIGRVSNLPDCGLRGAVESGYWTGIDSSIKPGFSCPLVSPVKITKIS